MVNEVIMEEWEAAWKQSRREQDDAELAKGTKS